MENISEFDNFSSSGFSTAEDPLSSFVVIGEDEGAQHREQAQNSSWKANELFMVQLTQSERDYAYIIPTRQRFKTFAGYERGSHSDVVTYV